MDRERDGGLVRPINMLVNVRFVTAVAALAAVTGCGLFAEEVVCPAILRASGIDLVVKAPLAKKAASATMTICWGGVCRNPRLELMPDTRSVPQGCTGDRPDDTCGASAVPTGDKRGLGQVQNLPAKPVDVAVKLRDADGKDLLDQRITVTPKATEDPGCPKGPAAQAGIAVENGRLVARP